MHMNDKRKTISDLMLIYDGFIDKQNPDSYLGELIVWYMKAIQEKSKAVLILLDASWHGGLIEIVRGQMEAAADLMLLISKPDHIEVILARQNSTVISVVNRATSAKKAMTSVHKTLRDPLHGPMLMKAKAAAESMENRKGNKSFSDLVAESGMDEGFYRYLSSFAHHNCATLKIRFGSPSLSLGSVSDDLLLTMLQQVIKNMAGPMMKLAERKNSDS